ncbi:MAG: hypothetical protein HFH49_06600 [Lachnospiraceae bacterium]|nr:hypothetical protein [Lachnospiraceae bacterium]
MKYSWKNRIWYLLAVLMCVFFLIFHVLPLIEMGYQWYYKKDDVYLITGTGLPAALFLLLFFTVLWLFAPEGVKGYFEDDEGRGMKADFSPRKKAAVCALAVFITLSATAGSMLWYQRFTMNGVEYRCFLYKKDYTWQEVSGLTLKADAQGVLMFEFQMTDGKKRSFNGGFLWCVEYFGEGFEEKFPEDVYDYALWLGQELGSQKIPLKAEGGWEKLQEELNYESWRILAEDIRQCYEKAALRTGSRFQNTF